MSAVASPYWFPHYYDAGADRVLLVGRTEAEFRAASFLDDRSLSAATPRHLVPWREVAGAVPADARRDAQYIFHIGHVGSTLISRLLGELRGVLALREPVILRDFAECLAHRAWDAGDIPARLDTLTALLSRTFRPEQRAMVKATSFVSEIAADLVPAESKALLLYASPERYAANILAGPNSRQEILDTAAERLARLERRSGSRWSLPGMSEGERIGMVWASEMGSLVQAAERLGSDRVLWMDFDAFLAEPEGELSRLAQFFDLDREETRALPLHPLMGRYSKAPEHEYGPELRDTLLAEAKREHAAELAAAHGWIEAGALASPHVARALEAGSTGGGSAARA